MLKKKQISFTVLLVILLFFTQIMQPITSMGLNTGILEVNNKKLFKTIEQINLDDELVIHKDAYLYGEIQGDYVIVQYADSYKQVSLQSVVEVKDEQAIPAYHEVGENLTVKTLPEETTLYSLEPNEEVRIVTKAEIDYPISENKLGIKVVYFGNVEYYLSIDDRNLAINLIEDNDVVVGDTEENVIEEGNIQKELPQSEPIDSKQKPQDGQEPEESTIEKEIEDKNIFSTQSKVDETGSKFYLQSVNENPWKTSTSKYFKAETNLPVYDNRSGSLVKIGEVRKGQVYPRTGELRNWHQIQFGKIKGYVYKPGTIPATGNEIKNLADNIKFQDRIIIPKGQAVVYDNTSGSLVAFGVLEKNVEYPIIAKKGNWFEIVYAGRIGYVHKDGVKEGFISSDKYFKAEGIIPVYDNRTGTLVKVGEVRAGQVYPRTGEKGNWHEIQFGKITGYVYKQETSPANGNEIKNLATNYTFQERTIIPTAQAVVYDNTSGSLVPFGMLEIGVEYPIVKRAGNWFEVVFAGRVGYVHIDGVKEGFISSDKFFRAEANLPIYDNRSGRLVKIGEVRKDQVYPRTGEKGNWHQIQFGKITGYVYKSETIPDSGNSLENINTKYKHSDVSIQAPQSVIVYDNSSGLVPFGTLEKGVQYPVVSDAGNWWRIIFAGRIGYVYKANVLLLGRYSYTNYGITLDQAVDIQIRQGNYVPKSISRDELKYYLNVDNFIHDPVRRFQFLDLSKSIGVSASAMNKYLQGKGTLHGQGAAFAQASQKFHINELYLIAHAILETGHGTSNLASGKIRVGKISNNQHVVVVPNNFGNDIFIVENYYDKDSRRAIKNNNYNLNGIHLSPIFNMFGIGAYDGNADAFGAVKAFDEGWNTASKAIVGGAEWIRGDYIYNRFNQNTLYKMRWNPDMENGYAWKQYARDVGWAYKQSLIIYDLHEALGIRKALDFDIPLYK